MAQLRLVAVAVAVSCGLLAATAGSASAQETQDLRKVVQISGTAKNGTQFEGTYKINKFVARGDQVFAVGKLKGTLKNRQVSRTGVRIPVQSLEKASLARPAPRRTSARCSISCSARWTSTSSG